MSIFGIFAIIAGLLSLLLPETNKPRLPETLGDAVLQWVSTRRCTDILIYLYFFVVALYLFPIWLIDS